MQLHFFLHPFAFFILGKKWLELHLFALFCTFFTRVILDKKWLELHFFFSLFCTFCAFCTFLLHFLHFLLFDKEESLFVVAFFASFPGTKTGFSTGKRTSGDVCVRVVGCVVVQHRLHCAYNVCAPPCRRGHGKLRN